MAIRAASHIAIGVADMERSLRFYRDLLGLRVAVDRLEPDQDQPGARPPNRHAVYLRWDDGPDATFLVLDRQIAGVHGEPNALFDVGVHHVGFWVDNLQELYERLVAAGVEVVVPLTDFADARAYGEHSCDSFRTAFFRDPDGTIIQLDQRLRAE